MFRKVLTGLLITLFAFGVVLAPPHQRLLAIEPAEYDVGLTQAEILTLINTNVNIPQVTPYNPEKAAPLTAEINTCINYYNSFNILDNVIDISTIGTKVSVNSCYHTINYCYIYPIDRIWLGPSETLANSNLTRILSGTGTTIPVNVQATNIAFSHEFGHAMQWKCISYDEAQAFSEGLCILNPYAKYYSQSRIAEKRFDESGAENIRLLMGRPEAMALVEWSVRKDYRARMLFVEMLRSSFTLSQAQSRATYWSYMPQLQPGDVNRDGAVNSIDATILQGLFNANNNTEYIPANDLSSLCSAVCGDINLDWKADTTDVALILAQ